MSDATQRHLILVDDDPSNREIPAIMLRLAGYRVEAFADAALALARLTADPARYDGLLIDVRMPGLDGLSAIRMLRAAPGTAALPIMIVSAQARPEDVEAGMAAGANAYVTKPFTRPELLDVIRALVPPFGPNAQ